MCTQGSHISHYLTLSIFNFKFNHWVWKLVHILYWLWYWTVLIVPVVPMPSHARFVRHYQRIPFRNQSEESWTSWRCARGSARRGRVHLAILILVRRRRVWSTRRTCIYMSAARAQLRLILILIYYPQKCGPWTSPSALGPLTRVRRSARRAR